METAPRDGGSVAALHDLARRMRANMPECDDNRNDPHLRIGMYRGTLTALLCAIEETPDQTKLVEELKKQVERGTQRIADLERQLTELRASMEAK